MNKALGFGVVAGGFFTGMAAVPVPASAHESVIDTATGHVKVRDDHHTTVVFDKECDAVTISGDFKTAGGVSSYIDSCGGSFASVPLVEPVIAFRKCARAGTTDSCTDWQAA